MDHTIASLGACGGYTLRPQITKKLNPRTERVIAYELEQWRLWLEIGNESLALLERHHQMFRVSLSQIVSLLDVAMTLGRLSTGRETNHKPAPPNLEVNHSFEAALQKIYGA